MHSLSTNPRIHVFRPSPLASDFDCVRHRRLQSDLERLLDRGSPPSSVLAAAVARAESARMPPPGLLDAVRRARAVLAEREDAQRRCEQTKTLVDLAARLNDCVRELRAGAEVPPAASCNPDLTLADTFLHDASMRDECDRVDLKRVATQVSLLRSTWF